MIGETGVFIFGCIVTVFVTAAVVLLTWGAYRQKDLDLDREK